MRTLIQKRGHDVLMMNAGVFPTDTNTDISPKEVARAGGSDLTDLRKAEDRGAAMTVMERGVAVLTKESFEAGRIDAVLGLGGSGGTILASAGMRTLPVGVPKVMVSTVASGDVAPYVGVKDIAMLYSVVDIAMLYSVVDIAGLNRLSRKVLGNAVGMVCGALEQKIPESETKPLIAATMFGVTTPAVTKVRERLEAAGYEVVVFHATGSGGRALESLVADGFVSAVADLTTTELADELVGGVLSAGPERLEAAGKQGIPQVVSVGALDMVNFGAFDTVPEKFRDRTLYKHNDNVTLMRTTPEENRDLGRVLAEKLNRATGTTVLVLPLQGVSMIDAEGQAFYSPEADEALFGALRDHLNDNVKLVEIDAHINDDAFAEAYAQELLTLLEDE